MAYSQWWSMTETQNLEADLESQRVENRWSDIFQNKEPYQERQIYAFLSKWTQRK